MTTTTRHPSADASVRSGNGQTGRGEGRAPRGIASRAAAALALAAALLLPVAGQAAVQCTRTVTANVVVLDQSLMFNRLGAQNPNGMVYALKSDVINLDTRRTLAADPAGAVPGRVALRPDLRPRPMTLRVAEGDCLQVTLQNLLAPNPNPFRDPANPGGLLEPPNCPGGPPPGFLKCPVVVDEQVRDRYAGFNAEGMQLANGIEDDSSYVGRNPNSLVPQGGTRTFTLFAEKEGVFQVNSYGATFGSEGLQGNTANGLFGAVMVEPRGGKPYRSQITEEEMRLATRGSTPAGQPVIDYEALYPAVEPWLSEGKAGLPVIAMQCSAAAAAASAGKCAANELVHTDINAIIMGPNADGSFPPSTYPLESVGKRNPTVPNRLEPFREFASYFHDEVAAGQAFPGFFDFDPVFSYVLAGVRDSFMINYGSGGIGAEIIANRLGVGPMHDCLDCSYEEFFLTAFTVGDPALLVDVPANVGLELCGPNSLGGSLCAMTGPKADVALYPDDPSNVHHSYTGDFVKFRNLHNGKEQHIFHLHNHQWLYSPSDDDSNYLDAQGLGPGAGYTYEINFGGSGNRNKTAGDAIFHCHFYPHFAMGMWYLWRVHDVLETGTPLAVSGGPGAFHPSFVSGGIGLGNGKPAAGGRALPDGEVLAGTPIPALVPLPGKPMAPMPGRVEVVAKDVNNDGIPDSSQANVIDRGRNPGYPFWIAGIDCGGGVNDLAGGLSSCASGIVGQRPPTPPLDMLDAGKAAALGASGETVNGIQLWSAIDPAQSGGFDGGLPRHSVDGFRAGGTLLVNDVNRLSFAKEIASARAVFFPEEGTDLEKVAMAYHAVRNHPSTAVFPDGTTAPGNFVLNGAPPMAGAPFNEPCIDDQGKRLTAAAGPGQWFGATPGQFVSLGGSVFTADRPRIYKAANVQFDAVLSKTGYHYPQQRIVALWEDVVPTIEKRRPPEPLVFRMNTLDCAMYQHTNLVPKEFELDDYQVRTPTDIIGQHIHLPKWDLTTADGAANGWNYEDGTLSPGKVQERIEAFNHFNPTGAGNPADSTGRPANTPLVAQGHPYFDAQAPTERIRAMWKGARTTLQRWFADPVLNVEHVDRGLGIIFTHDHYGPSTHQQIGLYSTLLTEPAGSKWVHNETGQQLGYDPATGAPAFDGTLAKTRIDGGPTSWQAAILTPDAERSFREFYFEFSDFQHAYEAGVYVGADQQGVPDHADIDTSGFVTAPGLENTFRRAINPPNREQITDLDTGNPFPDLVVEHRLCPGGVPRPCPQAISVQDPGLLVVNYRIESVGLRVYDPARPGPDGKPGSQADGLAGDLAFALQSRTDRRIPELNVQPGAGAAISGTVFPPPINAAGAGPGDPFTPMVRAYSGDQIRVKMQAGGQEEENNATIHGMKWLQAGSGHGAAKNSGWRNSQAAGISEQFTLSTPVITDTTAAPGTADYLYTMNGGNDGFWSGTWGVIRVYDALRGDLYPLPANPKPLRVANRTDFNGMCPKKGPDGKPTPQRNYDVTAVLANNVLANALGVSIIPEDARVATLHVGGALNPAGGTLVYNPRSTDVPREPVAPPLPGVRPFIEGAHTGPLHDPTAMMYVRTDDLEPAAAGLRDCQRGGVRNMACPVRLKSTAPVEPLVLRAAAGECVNITLRNRLPALAPDLATFTMLQGAVKRDRDDPRGSTTFNLNLIRPSSHVGLHPQLVAYDVTRSDGANVGGNPVQTVAPGGTGTFQWYAGDLNLSGQVRALDGNANQADLVATPVEFGGFNLAPADRIKQGSKSLVGAGVVLPRGAAWAETDTRPDHQDLAGTRLTRASATVNPGKAGEFRDFSVVIQKALTQHYAGGAPVEHMNGLGLGIPEDSQESTNMAVNYGTEPLWFRFQVAPNAPFENEAGGFGGVANAHEAYSNLLAGVGGDPVTPVFTARPGQPFRMHVGVPHGTTRGTTFTLHGHVWQRAPYVCPGSAAVGIEGKCGSAEVGSRALGDNRQSFYQGAQESITPYAHFDLVLPGAGGAGAVRGDYLFRDRGGFGNAGGLWGLLRVE
jgi:hypothetical protein